MTRTLREERDMTKTPNGGTIAEQLADYVTRMKLVDLPPQVVEKTKQCILDTLGCMMAGSRDPVVELVINHVQRHNAPGPCTIWGRPGLVAPEQAGFANGASAWVLELADGHRPSDNHLGSVVVPTALAMAQATGASGEELIMAVVLAYDVMGRVGEAVLLPRQDQPFHHTGTTGVFGSAAAAGRLLGMNSYQIANTLGVAGDGASGLKAYDNSIDKHGNEVAVLHVGRAVQTGITAAYLVLEGFEGPLEILGGRRGFCRAFAGVPRPELICLDLGQRFAVVESGFKVHASTGGRFTSIDAALWLRREYNLDPDAIEQIRVIQPRWALDLHGDKSYPKSSSASRRNNAYVVAAALVDGELTHHQHRPEKLADPRIVALVDRMEFASDPEVEEIYDAFKDNPQFFVPCAVEIKYKGRTYRRLEQTPLGYNPERPLSRDQVVAKFNSLVREVISDKQADQLVDWAFRLDRNASIGELAEILNP